MSVAPRNLASFHAVQPADLAAYLRATGWYEAEPSGPYGPVWRLRGQPSQASEILFPHNPTFLDYGLRMEEAIHNLAVVERRSEEEILADIATAEMDVIRIRLRAPVAGDRLSLEAGVHIFNAIIALVRFAAWAALDPRPVFKGRAPAAVRRYLREGIGFGPTERGGYVVTLRATRLYHRPADARALYSARRAASLPRSATSTMASALATISTLMRDGRDREPVPLSDITQMGVSANLCEALARIVEAGADDELRFDFSWSSAEPAPEGVRSIGFPRASASALLRLAARLSGRDFEYQATSISMISTALNEPPPALTQGGSEETEVHGCS